jgi:chromate transporter
LSGPSKLPEVGATFLKLGLTSFGGPVAHLGYFRRECVERRRWLDEAAYADLVALCQVLPGPSSSQVAFGLGMRRAGLAGALLASACFMLPSAALMVAFAQGVTTLGNPGASGWLRGLKLAAVAVVARAVWAMARTLCPDWPRRIAAAAAAALVLSVSHPAAQIGVIVAFALAGSLATKRGPNSGPADLGRQHAWAAAALVLFGLLLVVLPVAARIAPGRGVEMFTGFYRSGALVFGGGHVVLPLLRSAVVMPGWISDNAFLAGYGAVQAMPGPLFTFAAYLGAMVLPGQPAWCGALLALLAIFLPGWLVVGGAYPFWTVLRSRGWFQGAIRWANVAVVGVLLAALWRPLATESITGPREMALAVAALVLLSFQRFPQWAVVVLLAAAGQVFLR